MRSLHWKLTAAFATTVLVLLVGGASLWAFEQERRALESMRRARGVVDATRELREALLDAETGQRGFVLTQEDQYLAPWRDARARMAETVTDFDAAATRGGLEPARIAHVRRLVEQKLAEIEASIELVDGGEMEQALGLIETDVGLRQMTLLRGALEAVESEQLRRFDRWRERLDERRSLAQVIVAAGTASAFVLLLLVYLGIRSDLGREERDRAELAERAAQLTESNTQLEAQLHRVAQLTGELSGKNAELESRNRDLDQFAYVASHDLRAPLRGIRNLADWIEEDLGEAGIPETTREHLSLLRGRIARMEGLIDGVLQYSRAARRRGDVAPVELAPLVHEVLDLLGEGDDEASRVKLDPSLEGVVLAADRTQLQQVIQNLVSNALKHAPAEEPKVVVSARRMGDRVELCVSDNGPGIDPRFHERIFGIFQTLAPRDEVEGTGIGLAVVRKIAETNGGEVRVESRVGEGAAFYVSWPLATTTLEAA